MNSELVGQLENEARHGVCSGSLCLDNIVDFPFDKHQWHKARLNLHAWVSVPHLHFKMLCLYMHRCMVNSPHCAHCKGERKCQ